MQRRIFSSRHRRRPRHQLRTVELPRVQAKFRSLRRMLMLVVATVMVMVVTVAVVRMAVQGSGSAGAAQMSSGLLGWRKLRVSLAPGKNRSKSSRAGDRVKTATYPRGLRKYLPTFLTVSFILNLCSVNSFCLIMFPSPPIPVRSGMPSYRRGKQYYKDDSYFISFFS